jgi:hypothetical protein
MSVETISDEALVRFYENIRQRAEADRAHKQNFATGPTYADKMQMARPLRDHPQARRAGAEG